MPIMVVRNLRHVGDLDEVEVPQQADPHDRAEHMQPAEEEDAEGGAGIALGGVVDDEQNRRQDDSGDHGPVQIGEDCSHVSVPLLGVDLCQITTRYSGFHGILTRHFVRKLFPGDSGRDDSPGP
jgi:hypothetical protein